MVEKVENIYILTHTDLDGFFSAGLTKYFYLKFANQNAEFKIKHWTYGRDLPATSYIKSNFDKIFILDLCPDTNFMLDLYDHFKENFIWIDHHVVPDKEFVEAYKAKYNVESAGAINGARVGLDHTKSALMLTWEYFHITYVNDRTLMIKSPEWVNLLSEFDAWVRKDEDRWKNKVMPFFTYMKEIIKSGEDAYNFCKELARDGCFFDIHLGKDKIVNHKIEACIEGGKLMYKELQDIYDSEAKHGFERRIPVYFGDYKYNDPPTYLKAWICNTQNRSSVIFENLPNRDEYDVFIPFHYNGEKWFYSMYTFKPDIECNKVSVLFKKQEYKCEFRGHKDAAGANSTDFIFAEPNP